MNNALIHSVVACLDLTSLNESDTEASITELCAQAMNPIGPVAAVCVYPRFVKLAKNLLAEQAPKIATVSNFPSGRLSLAATLAEIELAIANGADEIDVVLPYHDFMTGKETACFSFLKECRALCSAAIILKVILESGELADSAVIYSASTLALEAGADFIKTSTGKTQVGATLMAVEAMLTAIQDYQPSSDRTVGLKISGGVRKLEQAQGYYQLIQDRMGENWINPQHFRLGASGLLIELLQASSAQ